MANLTKPAASTKKVEALVLIEGADAITKSIQAVSTTGKKYDKLLHLTACSILAHVSKHRETSLINKLVNALAGSTRKKPLIEWFLAHGECQYNESTKALDFRKEHQTQQIKAEATPFWEFKPEAEYKAFDLAASLKALIDRAVAAEAKHAGKNLIQPEMLAALKAIVPAAPEKKAA